MSLNNGRKVVTLEEATELFKTKFPSYQFDAWEDDEGEFHFHVKMSVTNLQYLLTQERTIHDITEY